VREGRTVVKGNSGKRQRWWQLATTKKNSDGTKKSMKTVVTTNETVMTTNKTFTSGGEKPIRETKKRNQ